MKHPQSKQPTKTTSKTTPPTSKPRPVAAKTAPKRAARESRRKPATAARVAVSKPPRISNPGSTDAPQSKQSQLIALLGSTAGASMEQMITLTGWQRHTVRGAISGALRKRLGLNVLCKVEEGVRIYRITEAAAA